MESSALQFEYGLKPFRSSKQRWLGMAWWVVFVFTSVWERTTTFAQEGSHREAEARPIAIAGVPNAHQVHDDLYRSGQPTADGMQQLAAMGVTTIINLRSFHSDRDEIGSTGLAYEHIYMKAWHPEEKEVVRFLQIVTDPRRLPALVHCQHGSDRTGTMIALYRIVVEGWTKQQAIQEMVEGDYGFHAVWVNLPAWIESLDMDSIRRQIGEERIAQARAALAKNRVAQAQSLKEQSLKEQNQDPANQSLQKEEEVRSLDELMLFMPTRYPEGDWDPPDLNYRDVDIVSKDGTKVHAWYCPAENPRLIMLYTHGNAGHIASRVSWLRYLQKEARVSVLALDYRGYGKSDGKPTVAGAIEDAQAARDKLAELAGVDTREIVLMGESLGGAIAVQLAAEKPAKGLILQSTFASLYAAAKVHFPSLAWLVPKNKLNSIEKIKQYQGPLFQSHGNRDQTIPFQQAAALYRSANSPKSFMEIAGADHNDWRTPEYLEHFQRIVREWSGRP